MVGVIADQSLPESLAQVLWGEHVLRCAGCHQAIRHEHHIIAMTGLVDVMRGDDDDAALARVELDDHEDAVLAGNVQTGDRLVEHEHVGLPGQHLGDAHSLLLTAAETAEGSPSELGDVQQIGRLRDGVVVGLAQRPDQPAPAVTAHRQHFPGRYRHPTRGRMLADISKVFRHPADVPRRGAPQSCEACQHRRLARAVHTHDRGRGARLKGVAHALQCGRSVELDCEVLD